MLTFEEPSVLEAGVQLFRRLGQRGKCEIDRQNPLPCRTPTGSDNLDWRDLRALGKVLGSVFFGPRSQARISQ